MKTVFVNTKDAYAVSVKRGLLFSLPDDFFAFLSGKTLHIVTDDTVAPLYLAPIQAQMQSRDIPSFAYVLPHGEAAKTEKELFGILSGLIKNGATRADCLLALGGGTVGDVTGLCASLYMRGIPYFQMPTTLLAAVDASVGGKCAVNLPEAKNAVGAFYQPTAVYIDTDTFLTLPPRVMCEGWAEIIKARMIDADFDAFCENHTDMEDIVAAAVAVKAKIVEADEKERGLRKILNFGHTFAHAIEACADFSVLHGDAVAVGMTWMTRAAVKRGFCPASVFEKLQKLLDKYSLPTDFSVSADRLADAVMNDKKRHGDKIDLIVPTGVCGVRTLTVPVADILSWIEDGKE